MFNLAGSGDISEKSSAKVRLGSYARQYALIILLVVMVISMSILSPTFLSVTNISNILRQISFTGIAAMGMTFVIISGCIDLSIGAIAAYSGVIASSMMKEFSIPIPVAILIGLFVGLVLGSANGVMISKFRVPPFIATVVMMNFASGLAYIYKEAQPIYDLPQDFRAIASGSLFGVIPNLVLILMAVFLICHFTLKKTVFGKRVYAIGGSESAAKYSGIKTARMRIYIYAIMGLLAAVVGILFAARSGAGDPGTGDTLAIDAIAATVMGGTSIGGGYGTVFGSFIGAVIIGLIDNALIMMNVSPWYTPIVKALVILVAVLVDRKKKA